mmetsp:Transcript_36689/g.105799  ORF Transcript_36689/g.105799 Transcript_36689/m.105799 type:complete len:506 (-) Transcript_36689:447-1964(-)
MSRGTHAEHQLNVADGLDPGVDVRGPALLGAEVVDGRQPCLQQRPVLGRHPLQDLDDIAGQRLEGAAAVGLRHRVDGDLHRLLRHPRRGDDELHRHRLFLQQRRHVIVIDVHIPGVWPDRQPRRSARESVAVRRVGPVATAELLLVVGRHATGEHGPNGRDGSRALLVPQAQQGQVLRRLLDDPMDALGRIPQGRLDLHARARVRWAVARLEVVAPGDEAPLPHVARDVLEGLDNLDGHCVAGVIRQMVFSSLGDLAKVPVLHATASVGAEARRGRRRVAGGVLLGLLRPALLDVRLVDVLVEGVLHRVAEEGVGTVPVEAQLFRVENFLLLRHLPLLLHAARPLRHDHGCLRGWPLLSLALHLDPLPLRPDLEHVHLVRDALVGLPRRSAERLATVLHLGVVDGIVGRPPLHHVEVLIETALRVHDRLPRREVLDKSVDPEPLAVGRPWAGRRFLPQGPSSVGPRHALTIARARPCDGTIQQALLHIQGGSKSLGSSSGQENVV